MNKDQQSVVVSAFTSDQNATYCYGMIEINGVVLANIQTEEHGCELHKLDEQGGASLFADINAGPSDYSYNKGRIGLSPNVDGWYYFQATDGINGTKLWATDGATAELVGSNSLWPEQAYEVSRSILNGRLYLTVEFPDDEYHMYSASGLGMRLEPDFQPDTSGKAQIIGTFHDKLLLWGEDEQNGREPWIFDGTDYQLLGDLKEGSDSSLDYVTRFLSFDDYWFFDADKLDSQGNEIPALTRTDGITLEDTDHSGPWSTVGEYFVTTEAYIRTSSASYLVQDLNFALASPSCSSTEIVRVGDVSSADYSLSTDCRRSTAAILNDDALVLVNNVLFRLGETSAEEIDLMIPSDWEGSRFTFVGSNPYFEHAYIKERLSGQGSRVWAWNYNEAGLLMADDTNVTTQADHFRHIGNDIYFYGTDSVIGYALRKIPNSVIKPVPRLAAVTGSWFDPTTSGQGLLLHPVGDDQTVVSYYGFENDGSPLWLTGTVGGTLETAKTATLTLRITSGGNFGSFTPDQITNEPWGTLDLTFDTCAKGTAVFNGISGQQTMNIERLARLEGLECDRKLPPKPKTAGVTGSWYDPATSGQGLMLHSMNDEQMVVSFYGYNNDSEHMWLVGLYDGQVAWGESLEIPMTVATGGNFGEFDPEDITRTEWGTLTINFTDCNSATAALDGLDGQQTMSMVKLAGLQGSGLNCH